MSEAQVTETAASSSKGRPSGGNDSRKRGFFGRIILFIRQVIAELKKVVTPTRKELINYTLVVLVFVIIMMIIVTILDFAFGNAAIWVFSGQPADQ
ncbi:MAG TPA: preprotein translocase subunit SecE [Arthrobacter sp.]|nr:preprotein translocase subunit SecE [Arthrobacter sp.]